MALFNIENFRIYWGIRKVLIKVGLCKKFKSLNEEIK